MRFFPLLLLCLAARISVAAPLPAFEGTLTQTQNGAVVRAKIAWSPPETLVIEVPRDDAAGVAAQTILTRGDETLLYDPATKRTLRYDFNIAKSWWRGNNLTSGGPANFLFADTPFVASGSSRYSRRDDVLFGGGGQNAYYAAVKTPAHRFPTSVLLSRGKVDKGVTRFEASGPSSVNEQSPDFRADVALNAAGFPTQVKATDFKTGQSATFTYDLKAATTASAIPEIPTAILEDEQLKAPSAYNGEDATALFNRGASLAANEDFPAAISAFDGASRQAPTASAPLIATYELALSIRDSSRATAALAKLEPLGLAATEIELRRARLALLQRDYAGALKAFQAASAAAPDNMALRLLQAEASRSQGDMTAARGLWTEVLAAKTSQSAAQSAAAQNLALNATFDELGSLATPIPKETDAQKLAHSLLALRDGKTPEITAFTDDNFEVALALGFERAARDEEAKTAWEALGTRGNTATKNRAHAHLMNLAARRGDTTAAIAHWRQWNAALTVPSDRDAARTAFFDAWQKASRSDALRSALSNRALATNASEEDMRLYLGYQELYGESDDVAAVVSSGLGRFPNSSFWASKKAESQIAEAAQTRSNDAGFARREQLYGQAFAELDRAIAASPDEPFYRFQKALAAAQRGAKVGGVIDPGRTARNRAIAEKETAQLLADLPGDPDALVSAALQNLAFEGDPSAREAIKLANQALDTAPGDGDRHTLAWAARQALATAYRRLKQPDGAARQWEILLSGARNSAEQSALGASYFSLLESAGDKAGATRLVARLAAEPWDYSSSRAGLEAISRRVAASPMAADISTALLASDDGNAILAGTILVGKRVERARAALQVADAPASADADLTRATRDLDSALSRLRPVANVTNPLLAARAAAFLAENANLEGEERLKLLRQAIAVEPRDNALRFALIGALSGEEAKTERDIAARTIDFEVESRRQLTSATRRSGDASGAFKIGEEAFAFASRSPEVGANPWQRIAFAFAKTAFNSPQNSRAVEIYNGLALPQWNDIDRAAAMLALSRGYQEAGKASEAAQVNAKVPALGLSQPEIEGAINFINDVEN